MVKEFHIDDTALSPIPKSQPTQCASALLEDGQAPQVLLFLTSIEAVHVQASSKSNALASAVRTSSLWCKYCDQIFGLNDATANVGTVGEEM